MAELRAVDRRQQLPGRRATDASLAWRVTVIALQILAVVLCVTGLLWLVHQLRSLIVLLVLSTFFAYLIAPLVALARRPFRFRGVDRQFSGGVAIGLVYLVLFGIVTVILSWLTPRLTQQVTQISGQAPAYLKTAEQSAQRLAALYNQLGLPGNAQGGIDRALAALSGTIAENARSWVMTIAGLLGYLPWMVLIPILAFFLLKDGEAIRRHALAMLPAGRARLHGVQLFERVNTALAGYIRAQLMACVIVGAVVGVGFALLRVPYSALLGVVAGLAEFVPLVGPLVVALVSAVIAGLHSPVLALWVLLFLGAVRVAEDYVVYPRLVGHTIDLHPLAIILAVLAGAELAGIIGVFLSVPALAVLLAGYRQYLAATGSQGLVADLLEPPRPTIAKSRE